MGKKVYVSLCLLACLLLGVSAFFPAEDVQDAGEKPQFINDDKSVNENFDSEFSDYISVRMPVRNIFLKIKAFAFEKIFSTSFAQDDVIVGRNGWYYFADTTDEFLGTDLLSERSVYNITDTVEQMQEYCEKYSVSFAFTVAPDKNTLYPGNMPLRFLGSDVNNYSRLNEKLADSNVNYVDFSDLASYSDEPLYYKTDSHWNTEGAVIAYGKILDKIGKEHNDYSAVQRKTAEKTGDLTRMLYPDENVVEEESVPDYSFGFCYVSRLKSEEDINIRTNNPAGNGSLLMFRDSFTNALLPFMAETFENAFFTRAVPCDLTGIASGQYDTVIYEIVQRNLANVVSYAPVMPSEPREYTDDDCERITDECEVNVREKNEELIHFYGLVDSDYLGENSRIYLKLSSDGEENIFRCFNIYEKSLYEDEMCRDNGFSVYIEKNNVSVNAELSLIIESDEKSVELESDSEIKF